MALVVLAVFDRQKKPVACEIEYAEVVRGSIVVDYHGAMAIAGKLKAGLESKPGAGLVRAAVAVPPGAIRQMPEFTARCGNVQTEGDCNMELDKKFIENIIREVIKEEMGKNSAEPRQVDPSGVISVDPNTFTLEKFPFPIESDRVWLKDVFSLEESPRMGCGIMEMEDASLDWTLQYDEIDYIIEGTLDIIVDGRTVSSKPGNFLLIPKGTKVTFSAKGKARFMYVVYPANWFEQ